jgi:hypothetical protein
VPVAAIWLREMNGQVFVPRVRESRHGFV